jgi:hypothetical protein
MLVLLGENAPLRISWVDHAEAMCNLWGCSVRGNLGKLTVLAKAVLGMYRGYMFTLSSYYLVAVRLIVGRVGISLGKINFIPS